MSNQDDFRFQSHYLLLELDAATNHLMMLVSARQVKGYPWDEAAKRQKLAYEAWAAFLLQETDSMPFLTEQATGSYGSLGG
ncbi:hypothetical protein J2W17_002485 [Pseudomonas lini]|jgi:hypothetical protein|uniref:hypothetical protein n=1 Tax=Pseudomonas lini TaxID=163011 RepID=UPI0027859A5B|nr:hypothetical protein [Pseudomonas lini]MDQ0123538.1 hypothetical protein [Pseudomonas lini]